MYNRLLILGIVWLAVPLGSLGLDEGDQMPAPKKSYYVDLAGSEDDDRKPSQKLPKPKNEKVSIEKLEASSFELINKARKANGAEALKLNKKLSDLARVYAKRLLAEKFFSHVDPVGVGAQQRASAAGIKCGVYENLGWQSGDESAMSKLTDLHKSFMDEPDGQPNHKYIVLHPKHQYVGIGIAVSGDELALVQEYTDDNPEEDKPPVQ